MAVPCWVTTKNFCLLRVIEGQADGLSMAKSLNSSGAHGKIVARSLNLIGLPMRLKAGTIIDIFTEMEEKQVESFQFLASGEAADVNFAQETDGNQVLEHLTKVYKTAKGGCE